jgi:hypothetical protein
MESGKPKATFDGKPSLMLKTPFIARQHQRPLNQSG